MIKVENLTKTYKLEDQNLNALENVNLEIQKGEFVVILGESGSGKSTLLNILSGIDRPTSGKILFQEQDLSKLKTDQLAAYRKQSVGIVFQKFNLINNLSVWDNVALPLKLAGIDSKSIKNTVDKALSDVGLLQRAKSIPGKLSGGQQQRVAIARALVNNPEILVCDEPTGNLDSKTGKEILELLETLNNKGKTIIMVTHNEKYTSYADRILEVVDGKITSQKVVKEQVDKKDDNSTKIKNLSLFSALTIALKNIKRRKFRFFLTSFGIAIGAMAIVILVSFGAGLQKTNTDMMKDMAQVEEISVSGDPSINANMSLVMSPTAEKKDIKPLNAKTITEFKAISGVKDVYPEPTFSADAIFNGKTTQFLNSTALPPLQYVQNSTKEKVKYGHFFTSDNENSVIIPYDMLKIFGINNPNDILDKEITINNFNDWSASASAKKVDFQQKDYKLKVVGVTGEKDKTTMLTLVNSTAKTINDELKQKELQSDKPFLYDSVMVRVNDLKKVNEVKDNLTNKGYGATSFEDMAKQLGKIFLIMQIVLGVIGSIALLVASLGVINTMLMAVLERTKEIGIMKAIGARNKDIERIFIFESAYIGIFGSFIGLLLGYGGSRLAEIIVSYYTQNSGLDGLIKFIIPSYLVIFVILFSMIVSAIAGSLPARRASKLDPVIALRDE